MYTLCILLKRHFTAECARSFVQNTDSVSSDLTGVEMEVTVRMARDDDMSPAFLAISAVSYPQHSE